jgi:alpha-galactosidase
VRWNAHFKRGEEEVRHIQHISADPSVRVTDHFPPQHSGEVIVPMVESLACDLPRVIIGNVPNTGQYVPGIPADFAVEIPTLVSRRGIQGIHTTPLPPTVLAHALHDYIAPVNVELEAYARHSRSRLLELIMMDPWTRSERVAKELLDTIMALPYHEEMREHFQ